MSQISVRLGDGFYFGVCLCALMGREECGPFNGKHPGRKQCEKWGEGEGEGEGKSAWGRSRLPRLTVGSSGNLSINLPRYTGPTAPPSPLTGFPPTIPSQATGLAAKARPSAGKRLLTPVA